VPWVHRHFVPDRVWQISHHCRPKTFLLRFARGRRRRRLWLFGVTRRCAPCVLNDLVSWNHIDLRVGERRTGKIGKSLPQAVAARTAREASETLWGRRAWPYGGPRLSRS
jgi:putative transposase